MTLSAATRQKIDALVGAHRVLLFMKGERRAPMCGFSAGVVDLLNEVGADYETVNILSDADLREGLKEYSQWPTFPQLFVEGKLVGGADIVQEMHKAGELAPLLGGAGGAPPVAPRITLTPAAERALREFLAGESEPLHLEVSLDFRHDLFFGPRGSADIEVAAGPLTILVDPRSASRAEGVSIDVVETEGGVAFRIDNPNEPPKVRSVSPKGLRDLVARKAPFVLLDVRPEGERALASLPGAVPFHGETDDLGISKDTTLVVLCHHGVRSRRAAERLAAQGYTQVFNLEGGIDAWSLEVDPTVPRY